MKQLEGKVAIVVGGAGGIGEATAALFVEEEAQVVVADIADDRGEAVAERIGGGAVFHHLDVTDESSVRACVSFAVNRFGRVDCLATNAAAETDIRPVESMTLAGFTQILNLFVRGVVLCMKHAAPVMKRQGSGSIVNTASVAGFRAGFATHQYSAAKAAVIHLTRSVAMELGESGVRVNAICPAGVVTPFLTRRRDLSGKAAEDVIDQVKKNLATRSPLKRACLPEDVAQVALWLAGDESGFVNGHALVVDGGASNGRMWSTAFQERKLLVSVLEGKGKGSED